MREMSTSDVEQMSEIADAQLNFGLSDLFVDITSAIERTEFTTHEKKVLQHILEGYNYSEVARETGISRLAVPEHFTRICHKLADTLGGEYHTELREK